MKRIFFAFIFVLVLFLFPNIALAQESVVNPPQLEYFTVPVQRVLEQRTVDGGYYLQTIEVQLPDISEAVELPVGSEFQALSEDQLLHQGQRIVVVQQVFDDGSIEYAVADIHRLGILQWLILGFFLLVLVVAGKRGFLSIIGMVASMVVVFTFLVPELLSGADPVVISLLAAVMVGASTLYLSHGFSRRSHIAFGSILLTLLMVLLLGQVAVQTAELAGLGSEEAYFLQFTPGISIKLQGLLLGGIIIGALGVLDDIIVSQVSVVTQLKAANEKLSKAELYWRGLEVGKDHVASLVNTLVLAYAGANLPLFLLFYTSEGVPWWVTVNNELIAEEVVRTVVGSIGLVLAVPITTVLAAVFLRKKDTKGHVHSHAHPHD